MADYRAADSGTKSADEALGWIGAKLDDAGGSSIGRIEGVYVDADDGTLQWLMFRVGRFGHHSLLPFAHAVEEAGRVWAPYEREMVRRAPRIDAGQPLGRERELELCDFYGIGEGTGRRAQIAGRAEGSVTARPVKPGS
jgi:hypothetical protein